jgi:hypothetical protein
MCIKVSKKLTVYFDPPFWVGVFEDVCNSNISTCKVIFGPEPKDYDVYEYILKHYNNLKFSRLVPVEGKSSQDKINPKRLQRIIRKQMAEVGIGTKAQQTIKAEYEANKLIRKRVSRIEKEKMAKEKYQKKQDKKKRKKRGH